MTRGPSSNGPPPHRDLVVLGSLVLVFGVFWFDVFAHGHVFHGHPDWLDKEMPQMVVYGHFLRHLTLAQWNPYIFCGMNFMGTGAHPLLYPPAWPLFVSREWVPLFATISAMLCVAVGLVASFLFSTHFIASTAARLAFAVAMAFSSGALADLIVIPPAYMWLPCLLFSLHLTMTALTRTTARFVMLQAVTAWVLVGGGWSNVHLYALALAVVSPLFLHGFNRVGLRTCLATASGVAVGVGLNAYRMLPFFKHLLSNATFFDEPVVEQDWTAKLWLLLIRPFLPLLPGVSTATSLPVPSPQSPLVPGFDPLEDAACYSGVATALFALYAAIFHWSRADIRLKALAFIVMVAATTPLASHIQGWLLGMQSLRMSRVAYFLPVALVPLAALSLDRIFSDKGEAVRFLKFFALATVSVVVMALVTALIFMEPHGEIVREVVGFSVFYFVLVAFTCAAAIALPLALPRKTTVARALLAVVLVSDALFIATVLRSHPMPFLSPSPLPVPTAQDSQAIEMSRKDQGLYRILGTTESTIRDRGMMWGLRSPAGFENIPPGRTVQVLLFPKRRLTRDEAKDITRLGERNLALTSTRYVVSDEGLWELPDAIPRFALFHRVEVVTDESLTLERLFSDDFPFREVLLVDRPLRVSPKVADLERIEVLKDELNVIELRVHTSSDAVLLINDTWDPGWTARVNGVVTPIARANHAFKAIEVQEGLSLVRLDYRSPGLEVGTVTSLAFLAVFILLALKGLRRSRPVSGGTA